jgi:Ca2+-binding EF-hand superfamily protein
MKPVGAACIVIAFLMALAGAEAGQQDKKSRRKMDPDVLFKKLDTNKDGRVSREEFLKLAAKIQERLGPEKGAQIAERLGQMFDQYDTDKKGLTLQQFRQMREDQSKTLKELLKKRQQKGK